MLEPTRHPVLAALALASVSSVAAARAAQEPTHEPFAVLCGKAITCAEDPEDVQMFDDAVLLVRDGRIEAVGPRDSLSIPGDYRIVDHGEAWLVPGMIDLHSHIGHDGYHADWHTAVYLTNPELRVSAAVEPGNPLLKRALAGGVTALLYIPGSATNMSGQGVMLKTSPEVFERMRMRDPGALKIAQAGNPENWAVRVDRAYMNWNLRDTIRRGLAYAKRWEAYERDGGEEPMRDPRHDIFRELHSHSVQIAAHTQIYQVVLMTITMLRMEFDLGVFIDHGTFDGFRAGALAQEHGVPAILGPRTVATSIRAPWFAEIDLDGRIEGVAAGYQEAGHTGIGFNTDATNFTGSGGVWTEDLALQGAMGVRYGMENDRFEVLRGMTIVPALAVGIEDRVGSLEAGKDADFVLVDGDPTDPRERVRQVFVEGQVVYDREETPTVW